MRRLVVTLRHGGKLYHTGELLRDLTLDPTRNYQPTGKPRRPSKKTP